MKQGIVAVIWIVKHSIRIGGDRFRYAATNRQAIATLLMFSNNLMGSFFSIAKMPKAEVT
jgi:hypothetical protein